MDNTVIPAEITVDGYLHSNACWNQIGVMGDRTCPELKTTIHCHNCPVYATAGRRLLERMAPSGYLEEWTGVLAVEQHIELTDRVASSDTLSVTLFRLEGEWLALSASLVAEVTPMTPIRPIPHRSNEVLLGMVNIRGEIRLCASLKALMALEANDRRWVDSPVVQHRMLVVEREGERWVFPVDEVHGIHRIHLHELCYAPATVTTLPNAFTRKLFHWQDRNVSYLDEELLFYTLNRRVL